MAERCPPNKPPIAFDAPRQFAKGFIVHSVSVPIKLLEKKSAYFSNLEQFSKRTLLATVIICCSKDDVS